MTLPQDFLDLSQRIGADPMLVQGPGGNTSIKLDGQMWIKASGTLLSEALDKEIFVAVDPGKALLELDGAGDGSCRSALIDPSSTLRPSIETTFHAMFPQKFVFHFHSVATISHAIAIEGRASLAEKLAGLSWVSAPYRKPGIPLTKAIRDAVGGSNVQVVVLENHGVIVVAETIQQIGDLIDDVERRLSLPETATIKRDAAPVVEGWQAIPEVAELACDPVTFSRATLGTYYPDHVVFLGPALPILSLQELADSDPSEIQFPAVLVKDHAVYLKSDATSAHRAMLECICNVLSRVPAAWNLDPIGQEAEAELLNWDAEKYRQLLAKRNA